MPYSIYTIFLVLFFCVITVHAQTGIQGSVRNVHHHGIPKASIVISAISAKAEYQIHTDGQGFFKQDLPAGTYNLEIHHLGFERYKDQFDLKPGQMKDFDTIVLGDTLQALEEVTVRGTRRLVEQKSDRMVIHVENSILASGMTALELLQRAPSVKVDDEGNINMRGKSDIGILINGKLSYLSPKELANILKGMSSETIKSIELITNPSAKFDAKGVGGLINIVMKKPVHAPLAGSVQAFGGGGRKARYGVGTQLNGQIDQWRWQGGFEYAYRGEEEYRNFDRFYEEQKEGEGHKSLQYSKTDEPLYTQQGRVGLEFNPHERTSFGILWTGNFGIYKNFNQGYNDIYQGNNFRQAHTLTDNTNDSRWQAHNVGFSFMQKVNDKHQLTADWDMLYSKYKADQVLKSTILPEGSQDFYLAARQNATPSTTHLQVAKIDYLHQLGEKMSAEVGWKSSWMKSDNNSLSDTLKESVWMHDPQNSNHFIYSEQLHAAYVNFNLNDENWGVIAGLRAERTQADGDLRTDQTTFRKHYTQLFPSISLRYQPHVQHQFQLSYSRRINRPDYGDLNPFRYYVDAYVYWEGNPQLQPELASAYEFNYTFHKDLLFSFYYTDVRDAMTSVLTQLPEANKTIRSIHNIKGFQNYGLNVHYSFSPLNFWSTQWNINGFENHYFGSFRGEQISNRLWSYTVQTTQTYRLAKRWSAEWTAAYESPQSDGVFRQKASGYLSMGLMHKMLDDKLNVKFAVDDLFRTRRYHTTSSVGNVYMDQRINLDSRLWRISLSYNFGKANGSTAPKKSNQEQQRVRGL